MALKATYLSDLTSFLHNRLQSVVLAKWCQFPMGSWLPQGSVLGPFNDLHDNVTCGIRLFAA